VLNVAVYSLARNPGWSEWLAQHPERTLDVIAETSRWWAGTHRGFTRFAKVDLEINGQRVQKGEMLQLMNQASGFDELTFRKACEFNPTRSDLKNFLFFGEGTHYCLGHALAKLMTGTALLALVQRYPQLTLKKAPSFHYTISSYAMEGLVVRGSNNSSQPINHLQSAAEQTSIQQAA
jgi:cytochrome P450